MTVLTEVRTFSIGLKINSNHQPSDGLHKECCFKAPLRWLCFSSTMLPTHLVAFPYKLALQRLVQLRLILGPKNKYSNV